RFQQRAWEDASRIDLSLQRDKQGSLTRQPLRFDLKQHVDGNHSFMFMAETAPLSSDPAFLLLPVDQQQRYELGWQHRGDNHEEALQLTQLDSLENVTGLRARASTNLPAGFSLEGRAGWRQYSNLTSGLIVGGMRDYAGFTLGWAVDGRNLLALESEYNMLSAQDGGALGKVFTNSLTYSYRLFSGERDWLVKTGVSNTSSSAETVLPTILLPLVPPGLAATPAFFVPESYTQFSLALAFGDNAEQNYQRGWRSFWDIGLTQDAQTGLGYDYRIGILGRVLGRDRLRFFISGDEGAQGNGEKTQLLNADYRLFY
ncbi:MAG: hypothetical protein REI12_02410, partial [Pedobacter sp.]|nr:hypothetical protein [Pedobacter sp.]